jgi:hypothetical protein
MELFIDSQIQHDKISWLYYINSVIKQSTVPDMHENTWTVSKSPQHYILLENSVILQEKCQKRI